MKKFIDCIKYKRDGILTGLLISLAYLFVIGLTYAILDYNLADGVIPFLFSIFVYVVETAMFLISLSYFFFED